MVRCILREGDFNTGGEGRNDMLNPMPTPTTRAQPECRCGAICLNKALLHVEDEEYRELFREHYGWLVYKYGFEVANAEAHKWAARLTRKGEAGLFAIFDQDDAWEVEAVLAFSCPRLSPKVRVRLIGFAKEHGRP